MKNRLFYEVVCRLFCASHPDDGENRLFYYERANLFALGVEIRSSISRMESLMVSGDGRENVSFRLHEEEGLWSACFLSGKVNAWHHGVRESVYYHEMVSVFCAEEIDDVHLGMEIWGKESACTASVETGTCFDFQIWSGDVADLGLRVHHLHHRHHDYPIPSRDLYHGTSLLHRAHRLGRASHLFRVDESRPDANHARPYAWLLQEPVRRHRAFV